MLDAPSAPATAPSDPARYRLGSLLGLALFAIAVRVPFLTVPMINDEGGYAYVAHFWARGATLYRDLPFDRPQGIFLVYRAILAWLGADVIAMRMAAALCASATAIALFFTARSVISRSDGGGSARAGWIAAALFAVFGASPSMEGFTANAELFANLPLVLAAYCTWKERWALAGLLAGAACFIKPSGVSALGLLLIWATVRRAPVRCVLAGLAAFAVVPLASLLHGVVVGWDAYFASLVTDRLMAFSVVTADARTQWSRFADNTWATAAGWAVPAVLAASSVTAVPRNALTFCAAWLACSVTGMSIGGNWYTHYYMQLLPPLAVLAGGMHFGRGVRRVGVVLALLVACARFAVQDLPLWALDSTRVSLAVYGRPGYLFSADIAEFITAHTRPSDSLYVAFSEAQLYYMARRRAAVPEQLYWNQVEYNERAFKAVMRALDERRPRIIVWCQPVPHWTTPDDFQRTLARGYRLTKMFGPIAVFERADG